MKLYDLSRSYIELMDLDLDEQTLKDTLEGIEGEIRVKADNICKLMINIDSDIEAVKREVDRLTTRKRTLTNKKEHLKNYLRDNMYNMDLKSIKTPLFSISRVKGRQVASFDDGWTIPERFTKIAISLDKVGLTNALKDGEVVEGASLSTSKESIRIK